MTGLREIGPYLVVTCKIITKYSIKLSEEEMTI